MQDDTFYIASADAFNLELLDVMVWVKAFFFCQFLIIDTDYWGNDCFISWVNCMCCGWNAAQTKMKPYSNFSYKIILYPIAAMLY